MLNSVQSLNEIFSRDLAKLEEEIKQYPNEESLWKTVPGISNSAGNLCLHLCGNLQHFIGHILGGSDYARNRDAEFALKDIPREKLLSEIEQTKKSLSETFGSLNPEILAVDYPSNVLGKIHSTEFFLIHLVAHLSYHLGQINYHRRLVK